MEKDKNFDDIAERFASRIYGGVKGRLRLDIIFDALNRYLNQQKKSDLQVWDAGCGMGQVAIKLAQSGHQVRCSDISEAMLKLAFDEVSKLGDPFVSQRIHFNHESLFDLDRSFDNSFDLIVCHAVLEWLEQPESGLLQLAQKLNPNGYISLLIYNVDAMMMYNLIKGNFYKIESEDFGGSPGSLTPQTIFSKKHLEQALSNASLVVRDRVGIRVVNDYLRREAQTIHSYEDLLAMEKKLCRREPFSSLGRYTHLLCQKQ